MTWSEKKVYVVNLVEKRGIKRKTTSGSKSRRTCTYVYHLKISGERYVVCKSFFLATLCLKEDTVYNWSAETENDSNGIPISPELSNKRVKQNNTKEDSKESAIEYLKKIPKLPSHYCRSSTSKHFLESSCKSLRELHDEYKSVMVQENKSVYGITQFRELFKQMNLAFFQPKKDLCDLCCSYKEGNIDEETYSVHLRKKNEARESKERDKENAIINQEQIVLTVDLQSLLLCPKLNAICLYYKTKLCCHNYTIFDLSTHSVQNYFWTETAADLTANTFASCIVDYLDNLSYDKAKKVIIYSDGCAYQNRNVTLANALLMIAGKKNITIEQKFLEKGHAQMECDSVHIVIERAIKKKDIYVPQQYVEAIAQARRKPEPYKIKYLDHSFFKDFSNLSYFTSIRPGTGTGSAVVTDIRVLKYTPKGDLLFKLNYTDAYEFIRKPRVVNKAFSEEIPLLNKGQQPIKKKKYEHLQQLKSVIPPDYHGFYDSLRHNE